MSGAWSRVEFEDALIITAARLPDGVLGGCSFLVVDIAEGGDERAIRVQSSERLIEMMATLHAKSIRYACTVAERSAMRELLRAIRCRIGVPGSDSAPTLKKDSGESFH